MVQAQPQKNSETGWEEARARLRTYLAAVGVTNRARRDQIIEIVLERVAAAQAQTPAEPPVALAMREVQALSESWFEKILAAHNRPDVTGMVSLFAVDGMEKWPSAFLADELPEDFERALRRCDVRAVPGLKFTSMVPQPFENPLKEAMTLPAPIEELAKELAPLVNKMLTVGVAASAIWGRMR